MARKMKLIAVISVLLTAVCVILSNNKADGFAFSMAITVGTISYHFVMRLAVGTVINLLMNNRANYRARWFQVSEAEHRLYQKLKVKAWKKNMPTYDPACFDKRIHSWEEIIQAMCQAEVVHEVIVVLSFVPILASRPFGAAVVFVVTSILSAMFDGMFVIMQRYNRLRITKMIDNGANRQKE